MRHSISMALLVALVAGGPVFADWKEPADKKFTEDQLNTYLQTAGDWADDNARLMQAVASATTDAQRQAAVEDINKKHQECLDRHKIGEAEFHWISQRVAEAWGTAAYMDDAVANAGMDVESLEKDNDQKLADAQAKLETYQAAARNGQRVLSQQDRDADIKSAQVDLQAATAELKQQIAEAAAAQNDAAQKDIDAKAADDLAQHPPSTVSDEDRDSYVQGQKEAAQVAREAARDARATLAEAKKAQADAQARVDAANSIIAHPEIPATDDEKAAAKVENDAAIAQAKFEIGACQQTDARLALAKTRTDKSADTMAAQAPSENVELMRKYSAQYKELLDHISRAGATSRPS